MKRFLYVMCVATICQPIYAAASSGQSQQAQSAAVIDWALLNLPIYRNAMQFAKKGPPVELPVPPEVDPPCQLCGDTAKSMGELQVDDWIEEAEKPEMTHVDELVDIERQLVAYRANYANLTRAAQDALLQFDFDKEIESALIKIGDRLLYDKALPMGRKYKTEPKRAYAGIRYILDAARKQEMLEAFKDGSDQSGENAALELVGEWVESIAKEIENDILTGHKYNLCPVYADILRQAEMSSGTATNIPRFEATIDKMDKLLRFDVKMKLHAVGTDDDGSHFDISWSTSALLHLKIDLNKDCYTPEFLNNGMMAVKVDSFTMVTKDGPVQLTSARSYQAPIGKPMLNLCDPNPVLLIPFNIALMPKETLSGAGHTRQGLLFGGFLGGVTSLNDLNTRETNEATGRNGAGPATPDDDSPNRGAKAQMAATQSLLEAHQNDPAWIMSDQGKAAIAALQQQAMDIVRSKVAALNNAAGNANSVTDMAAALQSAQLKWTNGNVAPAHDTFRVNKDTIHLTLDVDVRQQPQ